ERAKEDFRERLKLFMGYVENEITGLRKIIHSNRSFAKFSDGWERIVRQACYYVFFVHYGAKRRGETDEAGQPRDYVYHVVRSGFNCLIRKMRFLDEKSLVAAFMHDTREDYHKGFAAVLESSNAELNSFLDSDKGALKRGGSEAEDKKDLVLEKFRGMECRLEELIGDDGLSVSEFLDILTKSTKDRNRALLEIFARIFRHKDAAKRFSAMRALMVKIADRLDNIKTLFSDAGKDEASSDDSRKEIIKDETVFIFLAVAKKLGMWNVVEWLLDYIYFDDADLRKKWTDLNRVADSHGPNGRMLSRNERMVPRFMKEFNEKLCKVYGENVDEGRDYILEFRPVGLRYQDYETAVRLSQDGEYARAFRHYIIFSPVIDDCKLYLTGLKVFKELFPQRLPKTELERPELHCAFRKMVLADRGGAELDVSLRENGYSSIYGSGVWGLFESKSDMDSAMLGAYHQAFFEEGNDSDVADACQKIMSFIAEIDVDIRRLAAHNFVFSGVSLDTAMSNPSNVSTTVRSGLSEVFHDLFDLSDNDSLPEKFRLRERALSGLEPEHKVIFADLLRKLLMCVFIEKERSLQIDVNGDGGRRYSVPEDMTPEDALVLVEPLLAGRKWRSENVGIWPSWMPPLPLSDLRQKGGGIKYTVDVAKPFDPNIFARQTAFLDKCLGSFRAELLGEDFQALLNRARGGSGGRQKKKRRKR
ncbi:MAG: hypothetical protein ABIH78_04735, partial [Candidatus Peregrinibacteria bacterium]